MINEYVVYAKDYAEQRKSLKKIVCVLSPPIHLNSLEASFCLHQSISDSILIEVI